MRIGIASPFKPSVIADLLYPDQNIPNIHPSTTSLSEMIRQFILKGNDVVIFTYVREKCEDMCLKGEHVRVYITSSYSPIKGSIIFSRFYMIKKLKNIIEREINSLDVLHAHWTYDYAAASAKFADRLPVLCTVRDWCPKVMRMQKGIPDILYWIINWFVFKQVMNNQKVKFIANSDYIKKQILNDYPKKQVDVIYNLIDTQLIVDHHSDNNDRIIFVSVSQSAGYKLKNIPKLLEAYKIYRAHNNNSELWLIGAGFVDGGLEVKRWKAEGLLDGVKLCGYVAHDVLMDYFDKATCLVHPSLEESFGNILLEGMARHIPVIGGQKSGAVPYVLGFGKYGVICDVTEPKSICMAMQKIEDKGLVNDLTEAAFNNLVSVYETEHIVNQQLTLYNKNVN